MDNNIKTSKGYTKVFISENYTDNGELSHYSLIDGDGNIICTEEDKDTMCLLQSELSLLKQENENWRKESFSLIQENESLKKEVREFAEYYWCHSFFNGNKFKTKEDIYNEYQEQKK
jgi:hypothetical protein